MATTIHSLAYKLTADTVGMTRGLTATRKELSAAKRQMKEVETPLERFNREVRESATLLGKGAISLEQHRRKVDKLAASYLSTSKAAKSASTATAQLSVSNAAAAKSTGMLVGSVGRLIPAFAAVGAARSAISAAREFSQNMAKSTAIMSGVTADLRKEMERTAKEIGTNTVFSASQAAEAYFFLASAGLDAKRSIEALPTVATFAQAGMFDLATATDMLTDAQTALGMDRANAKEHLKEMSRLGDTLVKANTIANASVQQFSESLTNKAAASMSRFNISLSDGVAVLAAFAARGIKGADAGTQFSIVMRDLSSRALENADAFSQMGVQVFDAAGKFRAPVQILQDLDNALAGLSDKDKSLALKELGFNDKSLAALSALFGLSGNIKKFREELAAAGGEMKEVAEKNVPPLEKSLNKLSGAWDKLVTSTAATAGLDKAAESVGRLAEVLNAPSVEGDLGTKTTNLLGKLTDFILRDLAPGGAFIPDRFRSANTGLEPFIKAGGERHVAAQQQRQGPQREVVEVRESIDRGRDEAQRNTAVIVTALRAVEDAARQSGVAIESPPGSR